MHTNTTKSVVLSIPSFQLRVLDIASLVLMSLGWVSNSLAQCTGGNAVGGLTPNTAWQTVTVAASNSYYDFTATAGNTYLFSFCSTNGGNASFDTEISINQGDGSAVDGGLFANGYNNDLLDNQNKAICDDRAVLAWTPEITGTYRVLITGVGCTAPAGTATMAYISVPGVSNVAFWGGFKNTDWDNTSNWLTSTGTGYPVGLEPTNAHDVFIPGKPSGGNDPRVDAKYSVCRNITINSGAILTQSKQILGIYGNLVNDGKIENNHIYYTRFYGGTPSNPATISGNGVYAGPSGIGFLMWENTAHYKLLSNVSLETADPAEGTVWVQPGASFDMNGYDLNLKFFFQFGNFYQRTGTLTVSGKTGNRDGAGDSHVITPGTFFAGTGTTCFNSDLHKTNQVIPDGVTFYTLKVVSNASNSVDIGKTSAATIKCQDLIITNPGTAGGVVNIVNKVDVSGDIYLGTVPGASPVVSGNALTLNVKNEITRPDASGSGNFYMSNDNSHVINVSHSDPTFTNMAIRLGADRTNLPLTFYGTVNYNGTGDQLVMSNVFNNLTISNNVTRQLLENTVVNGNLTINAGTLDVGNGKNYQLTVRGNWINNGGTFGHQLGTVILNGTGSQQVKSSGQSFHNLTLQNASASSSGVTLTDGATINHVLTLTQGFLKLNGQALTVQNNAATGIVGGSSNAYIVSESPAETGKLVWNIGTNNNNHVFPFGYSSAGTNYYVPFHFQPTSGTVGTVSVSTYNPGSANLTPYPVNVGNLNFFGSDYSGNMVHRFWKIDLTGADSPKVNVRFYYAATEIPSIGNTNMLAQRWNGNSWDAPLPIQTSDATSKWVQVDNVTQFSPWALGASYTPLPVTLVNFSAKPLTEGVQLNWTTASEQHNDYFTVEKSADNLHFVEVLTVNGAGTTNAKKVYEAVDKKPYHGISYYRLKQTDLNGSTEFSKTVSVNYRNAIQSMTLFQTQHQQVKVVLQVEEDEQFVLSVRNLQGRVIWKGEVNGVVGITEQVLDIPSAPNEILLVNLENNHTHLVKKILLR